MTTFEELELRLVALGLRLASSYCKLAETHSHQRHRMDQERVLTKARKELEALRRRLDINAAGFGTESKQKFLSKMQNIADRIELLGVSAPA